MSSLNIFKTKKQHKNAINTDTNINYEHILFNKF